MRTILVTGAGGQIGSELTPALRDRYGTESVIATDITESTDFDPPFDRVDITEKDQLETVVSSRDVDTIFHLAAILSASGEQRPQAAYEVNVNGLRNVLEVGREAELDRIIVPSSIAVFGSETPNNPGERTILNPTTIYGISKLFGEQLGEYYYRKFGLDVRGVRFPGIISHKTKPGGGTTDYAVEAFYRALETGFYEYFVRANTRLPMMYMPDAIDALLDIATAPESALTARCSYNIGAMSFTPAELTEAIRTHVSDFAVEYSPDERQEFADSWPDDVDDTAAREDWGWESSYDLEAMVADMIENLR